MGFPQYVSDAALTACRRCCCICHKFCGTKIELHHIKQVADGGEDNFENCIPLCFDCHADMGKADPRHNRGKKYTETELKRHRDNWYSAVANDSIGEIKRQALNNKICSEDKALFNQICNVFDSDICYWISNANMYNPYEGRLFTSLDLLLVKDNDPFFAFINQELEQLKNRLFDSVEDFLKAISENTYVVGLDYPDMHSGRAWLLNHGFIDEDRFGGYEKAEALFKEETDLQVRKAKTLWNDYCIFVRFGRSLINS